MTEFPSHAGESPLKRAARNPMHYKPARLLLASASFDKRLALM